MNIFINKNEIEKGPVTLRFTKLETFDDVLKEDLDDVIYVENNDYNDCRISICGQQIQLKKSFFCGCVYLQLNNMVLEPTKVTRDNFHRCGYVFYKVIKNETK